MTEQADIVIIGSGIAGALCAWRLARTGRRVLVLEAGPRVDRADVVKRFASAHRYDYSWGYPNTPSAPRPDWSEGRDHYIVQDGPDRVTFEYLRIVGGTTWHWAADCDRVLPNDVRLKSEYGVGLDWPFGYEEIEPYYAEAERELGVSGDSDVHYGSPRSTAPPLPPLPKTFGEKVVADILSKVGISFATQAVARNSIAYDGRPQCDGYGKCLSICPIGAQYAAIVHVEKAEQIGARVIENALAVNVEGDTSGVITGVRFRRSDGSTELAVAKTYIIAANAVELPKLLLASASERYPKGLANSSDQVGRNFMAHPVLQTRMEAAKPLYLGRGPNSTMYIHSFRDLQSRRTEAAASMFVENVFNIFPATLELLADNVLPPNLDVAIRKRAIHEVEIFSFMEQLPRPENRITIDSSERDSSGQPRIRVAYKLSDYEKRGIARTKQRLDKIGRLLGSKWLKYNDLATQNHLAGTLRMGKNPKSSVVDPFGRAHDHPNLYVVGGAVFPTCPAIAPTMTIAGLSLRTAEAIARQSK